MSSDSALKKSQDETADRQAQFHAELKANPIKKQHKKILGNDLTVASYSRPDFRVIVKDQNTTLDDVLRPEYWTNVGDKLHAVIKSHPFATIELVWDDSSKWAQLLVIDASPLWAKVKLLHFKDLTMVAVVEPPAASPEYEVAYKGPSARWCIVRLEDGERIKQGLSTKDEAQKELKDLLAALSM